MSKALELIKVDLNDLGKSYGNELRQLHTTLRRVATSDPSQATALVDSLLPWPLISVGSGGSYTVASFAALVHEFYSGKVARAATPLEMVSGPLLGQAALLFCSARGKNVDILKGLESAVRREPARVGILCVAEKTRLAETASRFERSTICEFSLPSGKDGFVATNSLFASCALLCRAYSSGEWEQTKDRLGKLLADAEIENDNDKVVPLWDRQYLIVVHAPEGKIAAVDLESKFSEAALGAVQITDVRNFAHGRHHWLAKRGSSTAILFLITRAYESMAKKIASFLPSDVPVHWVKTESAGPLAALELLTRSLYLVESAGKFHEIDPGRPGVPPFGSRIYHLREWPKPEDSLITAAINRKTAPRQLQHGDSQWATWAEHLKRYVELLEGVRYRTLILDYDGTLCSEAGRFAALDARISNHLTRLLANGIRIGIATGRGASVRKALRSALAQIHWKHVTVGYYNCSEVAALSDDTEPGSQPGIHPSLAAPLRVLESSFSIKQVADIRRHYHQITVRPRSIEEHPDLYPIVCQAVCEFFSKGIQCLRSTHSVDLLSPGVSKTEILSYLKDQGKPSLCIGDLPKWPGNDFELLKEDYALSVADVPHDPLEVWNVAPAGITNSAATEYYLQHIEADQGIFMLRLCLRELINGSGFSAVSSR